MNSVLVIQTGGTIDKDYPKPVGGYAFEIGEPASRHVLERGRPCFQVEYTTVCRKDSQLINRSDRLELLKVCRESHQGKILVTHGTDTLTETATFLGPRIKDKLVILTGARRPETFKDSDADFNVGVAVGALQFGSLSGVFVAMNGGVYAWEEVTRDLNTGTYSAKL